MVADMHTYIPCSWQAHRHSQVKKCKAFASMSLCSYVLMSSSIHTVFREQLDVCCAVNIQVYPIEAGDVHVCVLSAV